MVRDCMSVSTRDEKSNATNISSAKWCMQQANIIRCSGNVTCMLSFMVKSRIQQAGHCTHVSVSPNSRRVTNHNAKCTCKTQKPRPVWQSRHTAHGTHACHAWKCTHSLPQKEHKCDSSRTIMWQCISMMMTWPRLRHPKEELT